MTWSSVALVAALLFSGAASAGEGALKSGPQAGERLPVGPFNPVNVTNAARPESAGTRSDYTEQHGASPVVLIFARGLSGPLTGLVKKLDAAVASNRAARLRAVVVVLAEGDRVEKRLEALGKEAGNVSLALMAPPGPKQYKLAGAADVTVILYRRRVVAASHAFRKGELDEKAIEAVLRDVPTLVARR
jgi:hypothetical protein